MDSYEFDAIKIEKAKAMQRYRTFKKIATIVRSLEIFVVVILISWSVFRSSAYLPVAISFSGAFLRRVSSLLFCPHFVFLLGNAIIITLFANSRDKTSSEKSVGDEIFYVSAADSISAEKSGGGDVFSRESQAEEREPEVAKAVVYVPPPPAGTSIVEAAEKREPEVVVKAVEEERRTYRRSQSAVEKVIGEEEVKEKIELRRSSTVPRRKSGDGEAAMAARRRRMSDVDDLSSEEFRRRVEAFIEKQQQFLREESKALVLTN